MNNVTIIGNLATDPETKKLKNTNKTSFVVAVKTYKDNTTFLPVTAFGKLGDVVAKYLSKGSKVAVSGMVIRDTYEKNGSKQSYTYILAQDVEFLSTKQSGSTSKSEDDEVDITPDDIPFN